VLILIAVCALTVSVTTRYSSPVGVSAHAITTRHKHSSHEISRQRLTKDAATWMPALASSVMLQAPTFSPRVAPAGPSISTSLLLDKSLYIRPPPTSKSLA